MYDSDKTTYDENKAAVNGDQVFLQDYILPEQLEAEFGGTRNFEFKIDQYWDQLLARTGKPYKTIDYA